MNILALIPARMGSSRFPGKPMAKILGKPMIGHVYDRVNQCELLTMTAVATCDQEIFDYVESMGGNAVMTENTYERASDRCAEALLKTEENINTVFDIVVMVQGDEPMTHPDMLEEAIRPMIADPSIMVTNLLGRIDSLEEFNDRNCIKVVCDKESNALYFSRQPIPTVSKHNEFIGQKQVCIIPFRRKYLLEYFRLITDTANVLSVLVVRGEY